MRNHWLEVMQLNTLQSCGSLPNYAHHLYAVVLCRQVKIYVEAVPFCLFFSFFFNQQTFELDAMSYREGMTFCSMEVIAGTLLRFRQLIWIEVKSLLCFESVSYQTIAHNFLANSSVEMISFRRALPNMQYTCSVHLLQ